MKFPAPLYMEPLFATVEFPHDLTLYPSELDSDMYKTIYKRLNRRISGTCLPRIGYVKPGTVEIIKKQTGAIKGSHATGNVLFRLQVRCQATQPVKGQRLACTVVSKNETGILARNFSYPYMLFVPNQQDDSRSEDIDRIQLNSDIEVTIQTSILRAPSKANPVAEYWVICDLYQINVGDRLHNLPQLPSVPRVSVGTLVPADETSINRSILTNDTYARLANSKDRIKEVTRLYNDTLEEHANNDPLIRSMTGVHLRGGGINYDESNKYVLGKVLEDLGDDGYEIQVLGGYEARGAKVTVPRPWKEESPLSVGDIILSVSYYRQGVDEHQTRNIDFWGMHAKYVVNPNELIHIPKDYVKFLEFINAQRKKEGVEPVNTTLNMEPVSRSYYKMLEIYRRFDLLKGVTKARILCEAESPGGFIQALIDIRKGGNNNPMDSIVGISIATDSNEKQGVLVPTWSKLAKVLAKSESGPKIYDETYADPDKGFSLSLFGGITTGGLGADKGGDILNRKNIDRLAEAFSNTEEHNHKADLVTADGGFPHDKSTATEEMQLSALILGQIIVALRTQKIGGAFVLKIFDMATAFTGGMLSVLCGCYEKVLLFKPATSRPASSEKYVICKGFNVPDDALVQLVDELYTVLDTMMGTSDSFMQTMLVGPLDATMTQAIQIYNQKFMEKQMDFINDGLIYTEEYCKCVRDGKQDAMNKLYRNIGAKAGMQRTISDRFFS